MTDEKLSDGTTSSDGSRLSDGTTSSDGSRWKIDVIPRKINSTFDNNVVFVVLISLLNR